MSMFDLNRPIVPKKDDSANVAPTSRSDIPLSRKPPPQRRFDELLKRENKDDKGDRGGAIAKKKTGTDSKDSLNDEGNELVGVKDEEEVPEALTTQESDDESGSEFDKASSDEQEKALASDKKSTFSLNPDKTQTPETSKDQTPVESPLALYKNINKKPSSHAFAQDAAVDIHAHIGKEEKKDKSTPFHSTEHDLNAVNPLAFNAVTAAVAADANVQEVKASASNALKILVDEVSKQLYTLEIKGQRETIVILNNPRLFDDARLVVTEFSSATKEYNLAFENLTTQAKRLLDDNLNSLRLLLEEKGYAHAVHIITTTTFVEHHIPGEGGNQQGKERDNQGQNPNRERQRKKEQEGDLA